MISSPRWSSWSARPTGCRSSRCPAHRASASPPSPYARRTS
jgi:hypothetical protein